MASAEGRTHHTFSSDDRVFDPKHDKSGIDQFLSINKPSELCVSDGIKWIRVLGPDYHKTHAIQTCDVDGLTDSFQRLTHGPTEDIDDFEIKQEEINSLDQDLRSGKWMLFPKRECVDDIWNRIAKAIVKGKLGTGATMVKVSPVGDNEPDAYIAVYTPDYSNKEEVFDVEKKMREIGIKGKLKYKPDINTMSGVYSKNSYKVKPSIFETNDETSESYGRGTRPTRGRTNPHVRGGHNGRGRSRGRGGSSGRGGSRKQWEN